ncbi:response regulator [Paraurantiacibacter namhicola]|uniref:Polar-differentiation response regulator DivK n=1 Tax=Paraurantiacibacter namhicola TaxID=645517 RepID=A0A1C7D7C1_9SPHN|nr:response regulator [Paraurantiacibacter namhicola]ANU07386.1 Polar-differentiation response regulator DivK [Paraurantiacibacter namhicola]
MEHQRILVVEDDLYNRIFFCAVLEEHGFVVEQVADERTAIDVAAVFGPDLVVMDIQMPHISGIDLIRKLKQRPTLARVPVLAVTGYVGREEEREVRDAGASAILAKPVPIEPFLKAIENALPQAA